LRYLHLGGEPRKIKVASLGTDARSREVSDALEDAACRVRDAQVRVALAAAFIDAKKV
jgi:hypothetical protein